MNSRRLSSLLLGVFASSRWAGRGGSPVPPYPPRPPASNHLKSTFIGRGGSPVPPYPPYPKPPVPGNLTSRLVEGEGRITRTTFPPPVPPPAVLANGHSAL